MKNDRTSQFLARNREQHVSEMMAAEINASQIQYKGWALGVSDQYQADRSKCEAECPQPYHWPFASVSCSFGNHRVAQGFAMVRTRNIMRHVCKLMPLYCAKFTHLADEARRLHMDLGPLDDTRLL